MTTPFRPASIDPDELDLEALEVRLHQYVQQGHMTGQDRSELIAVFIELRAARSYRDYFEGRLELANEVIDAFREYPSGTMPMVDAWLRDYDATAEGGS